MKSGTLDAGEASKDVNPTQRLNRGLSVLDFILRIIAGAGTLASAVTMGTTNETLPFFTQSIQFRAEYDDIPSFTFFVIGNSIACGYLVLSLVLSLFHIVRSAAVNSRILLLAFDTAMLGLLSAAASAAASIVYLAHKGNSDANWFAICQQFNNFCERISGSLIGSFVAAFLLILLIITSAVTISRH
ncbi:CASP-like protein [Quillaja saponaria]|uniref:CASP-like protein n=1 Tax=Quillaja saponaria TaxID=32244 RepID=A0AAD7L9Y4_QUISA|nr:CASP-like protein [Quillaja saponaria]